jgi:glycerate kinase
MVQTLDRNLGHLAALIKRDLQADVADRSGAGAGGGMGAGLMAFTNAELKRGVELVVAATKLDEYMKGASLALTGEGRVDFQTAFGKTPSGVAASAHRHGVPVVAIGGGLADDANGVFQHGIDAIESATPNAMPLDVAIKKSRQYLQDAAERVARLIVMGQRMAAGTTASASTAVPAAAPYLNGAGPVVSQPMAKRNKPVKRFLRAKRVQGLTRAAVELSQRRRLRQPTS